VYYSDAGAPPAGGAIKRVPRTGGAVETVANTSAEVVAVRLDPGNVYFRDTTGAVFAMARAGGAARILSGPNTGTSTGPRGLAAEGILEPAAARARRVDRARGGRRGGRRGVPRVRDADVRRRRRPGARTPSRRPRARPPPEGRRRVAGGGSRVQLLDPRHL